VYFFLVMHKTGQLKVCMAKTFKTLYFANKYPACAFSKTYRKMLQVRRGGANYCCGGIENIELDISAHNTHSSYWSAQSRVNPCIYPCYNADLRKPSAKDFRPLILSREKVDLRALIMHGRCQIWPFTSRGHPRRRPQPR
jgi:hypothetical protein